MQQPNFLPDAWMTRYTEVGDLVPVHLVEDWSSLTPFYRRGSQEQTPLPFLLGQFLLLPAPRNYTGGVRVCPHRSGERWETQVSVFLPRGFHCP